MGVSIIGVGLHPFGRFPISGREMGRIYHAAGIERKIRNNLWKDRPVERFYDASWSLVRFLHATQPDAVARYLASIRSDSTMSEASDRLATFERHFGPLPAVEAAWQSAMRSESGDYDRHERRVRRATADAGASSRPAP